MLFALSLLVTIPIYNVGGSLNRNSGTRTNQNGPKSYGFRGNARNYDLNRDFIKSDTKNAKTFAKIFHMVQPDVFIDNHVSNGADYQYTLTHLFTQHNKLGGVLGDYLHNEIMPQLEKKLEAKEIREKKSEAKKQKKLEERANKKEGKNEDPPETIVKDDDESSTEIKLTAKELRKKKLDERKKALEEKKKRLLKERKSRVEEQKRKRDSIKINK